MKQENSFDKQITLYSEESDEFYDLFFTTVDNGGKYPGSFTQKEISLIEEFIEGKVLHLFSGASTIGDTRVDFSNYHATHKMDVFDFLKENREHFDTVILDPPYNKKFAERYDRLSKGNTKQFIIFADVKKTNLLFDYILKINPKKIIMKSWNWYVPKGYFPFNCYVCYAGGYRKPTFLMRLVKNEKNGGN